MEVSIYLLWTITLILIVLTIMLFLSSFWLRYRNNRWVEKIEKYNRKFFPLIYAYLDGDGDKDKFESHFTGIGLEYYAFENIVTEMLTQVEGSDADNLRQLLLIDPIFEHHYKQLGARSDVAKVKACNYFAYTKLINFKIIQKLKGYLSNTNMLLSFSAATALMASKDVLTRAEALGSIYRREGISEMALLELLYKFHFKDGAQIEKEGKALEAVLSDFEVPAKNRAILILGSAEIGYYMLADFLLSKMSNLSSTWRNTAVTSALIKAQSNLHNMGSLEDIRRYLDYHDPKVTVTAIEELSSLGLPQDLKVFTELLNHENIDVRHTATKALLENEVDEKEILNHTESEIREETQTFIERCRTSLQK